VLADFVEWCIEEGVQVLTVYAFSTENWNRDPVEVAMLMELLVHYCHKLKEDAKKRNVRIKGIVTDDHKVREACSQALLTCCIAVSLISLALAVTECVVLLLLLAL
jgi:undecaprenyl diphosphate synthase